jgi:membrane protein implicated in regulation of membrane protease activity
MIRIETPNYTTPGADARDRGTAVSLNTVIVLRLLLTFVTAAAVIVGVFTETWQLVVAAVATYIVGSLSALVWIGVLRRRERSQTE